MGRACAYWGKIPSRYELVYWLRWSVRTSRLLLPSPPQLLAGVLHVGNPRAFKETPAFLEGGTLHPYQLEGLNWMFHKCAERENVILADEMVRSALCPCLCPHFTLMLLLLLLMLITLTLHSLLCGPLLHPTLHVTGSAVTTPMLSLYHYHVTFRSCWTMLIGCPFGRHRPHRASVRRCRQSA